MIAKTTTATRIVKNGQAEEAYILPAPPEPVSAGQASKFATDFRPPVLEWLRADTLKPWRLQRILNNAAVRRIADEWNPNTFGQLIVSRRGGVNYLLDGQHRWTAIMREFGAPDEMLHCLVYEGLTDAEETQIFHSQGPLQRKSISGAHDAHVLYDGGDPSMVALYNLCQDAGVNLVWQNSKQDNTTVAVSTLKRLSSLHGPDHLAAVLTLLREALGPGTNAYSGRMMDGMSAFLLRYGDVYNRRWFLEKLRPLGVEMVEREANRIAAKLGTGYDRVGIGRAMHALYNKGRTANKLPAWEENVTSATVTARRQGAVAKVRPGKGQEETA